MTTLVELQGIMLSDTNQSQKLTCCMIPFILPIDIHNNVGRTQETYAQGWVGGANLFTHNALEQETEEFRLWNLSSPGERTRDIDNMGLPRNFQHDYLILQFTVNMLYIWSQSFQISYFVPDS